MDVVTRISEAPVDAEGRATERIAIRSVTLRDRPPPEVPPFTEESDAELAAWRVILDTTHGRIAIDPYPDRAPNHVRNFLRLADAGVYDGIAFHRVVPGFVIQSGHLPTRRERLTDRQQRFVQNLEPEFNDTPHVRGIVSMARLDDPASASTSFFIVTDTASELDGVYTVFGVVVEGLDVVAAIEAAADRRRNPRQPRGDRRRGGRPPLTPARPGAPASVSDGWSYLHDLAPVGPAPAPHQPAQRCCVVDGVAGSPAGSWAAPTRLYCGVPMMQPPDNHGVDWTGFGPDDAPIAPLDGRSFRSRLRRLGERARDLTLLRRARAERQTHAERFSRDPECTS